MRIDYTRDNKLTDFGKETLKDRYLMEGEDFQGLFARVARTYGTNEAHAQRIYDYISNHWFMPATPILSTAGNNRGLPISCFLSDIEDNMKGIIDNISENAWLSVMGGGIGTYAGSVRSIGERIGTNGKSSGVIPFLKVQDSLTLAINQGGMRRASCAIYLPIWHPEIEEFIELRRPTGGDPNRKCLNLHHAVVIDDKFMVAVQKDTEYELLSPKDDAVISKIKARDLWARLLQARIETGEPYMLFIDTVNEAIPGHHATLGMKIKTSNLCNEIVLPTGKDYAGKQRTAVCCLSSMNLETYDEWKNNPDIIQDVMEFLDNVLQDFINTAGPSHANAVYSAINERSVGLGVMGLHSLYQQRNLSWDSKEAYELNEEIFRKIRQRVEIADVQLAQTRGCCPDALNAKSIGRRFSYKMAIAPTASISIIAGNASPGIEPYLANVFLHKTLSGSFKVKNKWLQKLLAKYGKDTDAVWSSIMTNEGSVQHLDFLSQHEKDVFKTAEEIDQYDIIKQAGARAGYIDQSQSLNIFMRPDTTKRYLSFLHIKAWKLGVKGLYYCRSKSLRRSDKPSEKIERKKIEEQGCKDGVCEIPAPAPKYEVCDACQ